MPVSAIALMLLLITGAASVRAADPSDGIFDLESLEVGITASLPFAEVSHGGETVLLMRHQDPEHSIVAPYQKTARPCPPYCVQPMTLAPGVETIGELELIDYLRGDPKAQGVMVIDSRTPEWVERGTIPGAVNIPYTHLDPAYARSEQIRETLQLEFGAVAADGLWDFANVKTLVFFCNGPWCGQSPTNIKALLGFGYPAHKLKWYRGGLQAWEQFGLTTVAPADASE